MFTKFHHLPSWARSTHSASPSCILKIQFNTSVSYKWSLSLRFPTITLYTSTLSDSCSMHRPSLLQTITRIIVVEECRSWSPSLCSFLHSILTSSVLTQNTFLSTLISDTLSLCSSLNVRYQVSHPYKTTSKNVVLYILIYIFWRANWRTKYFGPNGNRRSTLLFQKSRIHLKILAPEGWNK